MRQTIIAIVAVLIVYRVGSADAPPSLVNAGFEQNYGNVSFADSTARISGQVAGGWMDNSAWAGVTIQYSRDQANPHGGTSAQKIEITRGFAQFIQPVRLGRGSYKATIWLRAKTPMWAALCIRQAGAPYSNYASQVMKIDSQWRQLTASGAIFNSQDCFILIQTGGTGTLWIDDAQLMSAEPKVESLQPPDETITRAYFGLNANHLHDGQGYAWPALDIGTFRTWDSGIIWPNIEPKAGEFHWEYMDRDVAEAQKHHVDFIFTLGQTPTWASSASKRPGVYGPGFTAPPARIEYWKDFVRAVATRYKGRIAAYEVWNEPDLEDFYSGTTADMVLLEHATREVLKKVDPGALLICPAVSGGTSAGSLRWLDDYLTAGGGKTTDIIGYHLYNYPAEGDIAALQTVQGLLSSHGLSGKPIWNTESGVVRKGRTEEEIDAFVAREYIIDWAMNVRRLCLYAYDNDQYTGLDHAGKPGGAAELDASGLAYEQVERWLLGAKMLSCACDADGIWTCGLTRQGGHPAWIVWDIQTARSFIPPASWGVRQAQDLSGKRIPVGHSVIISGQPLLLVADDDGRR